ncbi:helix-turn-helix domain-containing protein [Streptomyces sp. ISL-43]|uniref:helix-turn-helix domain-containing protein n=1 Tax=Streptomyces sp. ISL-43 TaxID=2819183 RepID=UPI001BE5EFB3|nr:helix-turn-helix domain-containing protein [Streptomyces sp. ISL-43]MBT2450745.1 helix-turn-helix domain-containing protein [Streptomyces sp. ISL-43]
MTPQPAVPAVLATTAVAVEIKKPAPAHVVAVLAFDGMAPFELGVVVEVFGLSRPELGDIPWYELRVCSAEPGRDLRAVGGFTLRAEHGLDVLAAADTVIIPGVSSAGGAIPPKLVEALLAAHARGARLVSICSGAFALAATGLLDGRRATTHWRYARTLAERHPGIDVDPDVLYVDNGDVLTSAGSAAGIDLCLYLVRGDHGAAVANTVARRFVVPPHREGGQAQFIEAAVGEMGPDAADDGITQSMTWAMRRLYTPLSVPALAREARMSERSFLRHFTRRNGVSPMRWVVSQRISASLPLLESGEGTVDEVAAAVGFDSAATFRHHFTRQMRTTPTSYRKAFVRVAARP